jgi:hypothetical protein
MLTVDAARVEMGNVSVFLYREGKLHEFDFMGVRI